MLVSGLLVMSCTYDVEEEQEPQLPPNDCATVSFNADVQPIIAANCAVSGCHDGTRFPNLTTVAGVQQNAQRIKIRTGNRSMPIGRTLTSEQIEKITCWVDAGALNN